MLQLRNFVQLRKSNEMVALVENRAGSIHWYLCFNTPFSMYLYFCLDSGTCTCNLEHKHSECVLTGDQWRLRRGRAKVQQSCGPIYPNYHTGYVSRIHHMYAIIECKIWFIPLLKYPNL